MRARRVVVSAESPAPERIAEAAGVLRAGGVVAFATDTLYGLAADPRSDEAVTKLFALKGRDAAAAIPLIASGFEQAAEAGQFGPREALLAHAFWPGPLSIVVDARPGISPLVLGGGTTVAVRVPAHRVALALAGAFGYCITATSANPSGARAPADAAAIDPGLAAAVDLLLDSGPAPGGPPSTMIRFQETQPILVRAGAVAWERVLKSLE